MLETFAGIVHAERKQSREHDSATAAHDHQADDERPHEERDEEFYLLPPEERVLTALKESGGRMWQQDIIADTGYSQGRVSKLLSEMEDDGRVNRYWKDGQKVVTLTEASTR